MSDIKTAADQIISDYKEHYDFPPQGESHMHDCITSMFDKLAPVLDAQKVRDEAFEHAAYLIENGNFIHDSAPDAIIAKQAAKAIRKLKSSPAQPVAPQKFYAECRQCSHCGHTGINDEAESAACHSCDWTGVSPELDKCPGCTNENCMGAACPKCGCLYELIASYSAPTTLEAPQSTTSSEIDRRMLQAIKAVEAPQDHPEDRLDMVDGERDWDNLRSAIKMACNLLERDGTAIRKEAADELSSCFATAIQSQPASKGDAKPFMYAIQEPNGEPYFDELCVSGLDGDLDETVDSLNEDSPDGGYKAVPVYLHPESPSKQEFAEIKAELKKARQVCRLVMNAFERGDAIDWDIVAGIACSVTDNDQVVDVQDDSEEILCEAHFNINAPGLCQICLYEEVEGLRQAIKTNSINDNTSPSKPQLSDEEIIDLAHDHLTHADGGMYQSSDRPHFHGGCSKNDEIVAFGRAILKTSDGGMDSNRGTFACPICGENTPHGHTEYQIRLYRNPRLAESARDAFKKCVECGANRCRGSGCDPNTENRNALCSLVSHMDSFGHASVDLDALEKQIYRAIDILQSSERDKENALVPAVLALDAAIHKVLISGDDGGDDLSDTHLRKTLESAQHVAYRALISIGIEKLPGAVNQLRAFLPECVAIDAAIAASAKKGGA